MAVINGWQHTVTDADNSQVEEAILIATNLLPPLPFQISSDTLWCRVQRISLSSCAACNPSPCSRLTPSQFHPEMIFKLENSGHATSSSSAPSSNSHGMVPHALQFNFPSAVPSVRYNISHPLPVRSGSFVLVGSWRIKFAIWHPDKATPMHPPNIT